MADHREELGKILNHPLAQIVVVAFMVIFRTSLNNSKY